MLTKQSKMAEVPTRAPGCHALIPTSLKSNQFMPVNICQNFFIQKTLQSISAAASFV